MKASATWVISRKVRKGFSIGLAEPVACKMPAIPFGFRETALSGCLSTSQGKHLAAGGWRRKEWLKAAGSHLGKEVSGPQQALPASRAGNAEKGDKQTPLLAPDFGLEQDQEDSHCLWCPQAWLWYPNTAVGSA